MCKDQASLTVFFKVGIVGGNLCNPLTDRQQYQLQDHRHLPFKVEGDLINSNVTYINGVPAEYASGDDILATLKTVYYEDDMTHLR